MRKFLTCLLLVLLVSPAFAGEITERAAKAQDVYQLYKELVYNSDHKLLGSAGLSAATVYITVTNTPTAIVDGALPVSLTIHQR